MTRSEPEPGRPEPGQGRDEDAALVARMAEGDETALGLLYDRWAQRLYSIAAQLVPDPDEAEDVLEDTFWHLWRNAGSFVPDRGSVGTWVLTVARNRALERLRKKPRVSSPPAETTGRGRKAESSGAGSARAEPPGAEASGAELLPEEHWQDVAASDPELVASLAALPPSERLALQLAYLQGMSETEIAERLGVRPADAAAQLRRAVRAMRAEPPQSAGTPE